MYKRLLSETVIYGIGAIMPRVINFLLNPYYIEEFDGADQFAQFINLYAIITFVNIVLTFGFETSFFRFSAEKENSQKTFYTSFWFLLGTATVFLIAVLSNNQSIADSLNFSQNPEFIRWFAWIAFFDTLLVIPFAWLRFNNKPIKYSFVRVTQSIFQTFLILAFFMWIPKNISTEMGLTEKVSYPIFSNVIGSVLGFVLILPIILKMRFVFDFQLFKRMLRYAWPVMFAGIAFVLNENFDKMIQRFVISEFDAGAYGGCYKLAVLMTLFVTAYRMGVEPFFFKQMDSVDAKLKYAKITEYFVIAGSFVALALIVNIDWLKDLFIRDETYWVALDIIPIIVIANLFFGIYYNLSTWYKVTDRTHFGLYISWFGAIVTLLLNLLLMPKYGFMVSAWATLAAYFLMFILSYYLGQKFYPIPYKINKIIFYLTLTVVFSIISYLIFDANYWIGNLLLLIFAVVVFFIEKRSFNLNEN
ncbi:MAG: polysaccharide biosynthesis C-terminal domain-containing protein [Flavobacteriaceae bacterium]|nr:polysaccharide biosynthesis C-terminal domain-containing protein [Flavobacteriaceae bacterium]